MKFEVEISEGAGPSTFFAIGQDLQGMWDHPHVLLAQPGNGAYVIHRVVPAPASADFDRLLEGDPE